MSLHKQLFSWGAPPTHIADENNRKYQLIHTITVELIVLGFMLIILNIYLNVWFIVYLLIGGITLGLINLAMLRKKFNVQLCGHIISSLCFIIITFGNIWLGGITTSYLGWFYISPLIAAVTVGLNGLIIYSFCSLIIISAFICGYLTPLFTVPIEYLAVLNNINHIFIFLLIFTTLYNLLIENKQYELLLKEQNFLLYADKQKFHYLSHHDSLTNLPNRSYFHHHLQTMLDSTNLKKNSITLYFMDLNSFKSINDRYGHETGDMLLLQTSKRLQSCFREKDFIARLGGDEFTAVIVHHPTDKIAEALVSRIQQEFKTPFLIKNKEIYCTISVGKANYPLDAVDAESLLKIADEAMYTNKKKKNPANKKNHDTHE